MRRPNIKINNDNTAEEKFKSIEVIEDSNMMDFREDQDDELRLEELIGFDAPEDNSEDLDAEAAIAPEPILTERSEGMQLDTGRAMLTQEQELEPRSKSAPELAFDNEANYNSAKSAASTGNLKEPNTEDRRLVQPVKLVRLPSGSQITLSDNVFENRKALK